jgi:putative SOS response-associated peptidase YedK
VTALAERPWYFTVHDGSPLLTAAGLWDEWKNRETGERLKSCSMIITQPNDFAAQIHDRMPVFLSEQQFTPWLSREAGAEYLKPVPNVTHSSVATKSLAPLRRLNAHPTRKQSAKPKSLSTVSTLSSGRMHD